VCMVISLHRVQVRMAKSEVCCQRRLPSVSVNGIATKYLIILREVGGEIL
jgi:hypothetical protein